MRGEGSKILKPLRTAPVSSENELIRIPKWFWVLLIGATAWATHQAVKAASVESRMAIVERLVLDQGQTLDGVKEEQLRRTSNVSDVTQMRQDIRDIRSTLDELKERIFKLTAGKAD